MADEAAGLVRQGIEAARDEISDRLRVAAVDAGMLGIAAGAGLAATVATTLAVTDLLHGRTLARGRGLPMWAAAGLTAGLALGLGAAMTAKAVADLRHRDLLPRRTAEELGEAARDVVGDLRDQHCPSYTTPLDANNGRGP